MSERAWPFDGIAGDRTHGSLHVARALSSMIEDGVAADQADELEVVPTAPESQAVDVSLGKAWVQGRFYELYSEPETLTIAPADATNPRRDRIVLRRSMANREITVEVLTGVVNPVPVPPALTQDDEGDWEISLAQLAVGPATTEIVAGMISDERVIVHPAAADELPPAASVYRDSNQSIPNNTDTAIAFNQERYDTDAIHDVSSDTSRLTCKTAGIYLIVGNLLWAGNAAGIRRAALRLNGATIIARVSEVPGHASAFDMAVSRHYQLAVDDYVELVVTHLAGSPLNVERQANWSPEFSIVRA